MKAMLRSMVQTVTRISRAKSTVTAPLANRVYLFNYFEKPDDVDLFKNSWLKGSEYVSRMEPFIATYLHHCSDPAIKYPWVNFAITENEDIPFLGKKDDFWAAYMQQVMKYGFKAAPAAFREIGSYNGNPLGTEDKERPESQRFFLTGIKAKDDISDEDVECNWAEWSGADRLHQELAQSNVVDSNLYKRFKMAPLFRYVVRTEVNGMTDADGHAIAKKLNRQQDIPGVETITGFYHVAIPVKKS